MLMHVEMDLNTVQVLAFAVYQYMCIKNCYNCNRLMALLFCAQNKCVARNRILAFAQRVLGSPRGKHCNSL